MRFPGQRGSGRGAYWERQGARRHAVSTEFLVVIAATVTGGVTTWLGYGSHFAVFVFIFGLYFTVLCLHEFGHAYAAHRGGDTSIESRGYLDLNPLRYVNPVLTVLLPAVYLIIGALPLPGAAVQVDTGSIRTRGGRSLVSASGPAMNIAAAAISMALVSAFAPTQEFFGTTWFDPNQSHSDFWAALAFFAYLQVAVAILNLIPVPGLDGYGIIEPYLRYETRRGLEPIRPYGILIVLALLFFFPPVRDAFSHAVTDILDWGHQPAGAAGTGQDLFKFWHH